MSPLVCDLGISPCARPPKVPKDREHGSCRRAAAIGGPVEPLEISPGHGLRDLVEQTIPDDESQHAQAPPSAHAPPGACRNPGQGEDAEESQPGISGEMNQFIRIFRRAARWKGIGPMRRQEEHAPVRGDANERPARPRWVGGGRRGSRPLIIHALPRRNATPGKEMSLESLSRRCQIVATQGQRCQAALVRQADRAALNLLGMRGPMPAEQPQHV